ncbi:hypothetical protein BMS3Abin05_00669 [bacterium BMS3Abin05]|nr:hypothetical protein BMS3Abin05_00669 [bacterium BMS3Abin05]
MRGELGIVAQSCDAEIGHEVSVTIPADPFKRKFLCFLIDFPPYQALHAPGGQKLSESFILKSPVGFIIPKHSVKPVVPFFVGKQSVIAGTFPAVHGNHRIFHPLVGIGNDHFVVAVGSDVAGISLNHGGGEFGGILPFGCLPFPCKSINPDAAFKRHFTDSVRGVCRPRKIVHVYGAVVPGFGFAVHMRDDNRRLLAKRLVFKIFNFQLLHKFRRQNFVPVKQITRRTHDELLRQCDFDIERSELTVEFMPQMLVCCPAETAVINRNFGVPLCGRELVEAVTGIVFHTMGNF